MIRVLLPKSLSDLLGLAGDQLVVPAAGTLGELLLAIETEVPGAPSRLVEADGEIRRHINVFIGERNARMHGGMAAQLQDGDQVWIIPAVSGGGGRR